MAAGEPDELRALVTAAEEMRDEAVRIEKDMVRKRMELGDTSRFVDLVLAVEPVVSKPKIKRDIRKRAWEILKVDGDAGKAYERNQNNNGA